MIHSVNLAHTADDVASWRWKYSTVFHLNEDINYLLFCLLVMPIWSVLSVIISQCITNLFFEGSPLVMRSQVCNDLIRVENGRIESVLLHYSLNCITFPSLTLSRKDPSFEYWLVSRFTSSVPFLKEREGSHSHWTLGQPKERRRKLSYSFFLPS